MIQVLAQHLHLTPNNTLNIHRALVAPSMSILGAGDGSSAIALQECVLHTSLRRLHAVHGRPCLTDYTSTVLTKPPGRCQAL